MKRAAVILMLLGDVGLPADALSRHGLNVAQDPPNLEGAVYGNTLYSLNLRAGPSGKLKAIGTVRRGAEVPILGWITGLRQGELWVRTWYGGKKGWVCAFREETRLIARDVGPLFPLAVAAEVIKLDVRKRREVRPDNRTEPTLRRGDVMEFISIADNDFFSAYFDECLFYVRYEDVYGLVNAFGDESNVEEMGRTGNDSRRPWAVTFTPDFLSLSLEYNYGTGLFDFIGPEECRSYYGGPGFEYEKFDPYLVIVDIVFVEGRWALVKTWGGFGWVYIGTAEEPNIQTYGYYSRDVPCAYPPSVPEDEIGDGLDVAIKGTRWPRRSRVCVELTGAYFDGDLLENTTVDFVAVYQPPGSDTPLYNGPPGEVLWNGWHETVFASYSAELSNAFAYDRPFRVIADFSYKGRDEFEMEFLCNEGE
jgi:hypothetical protein